MRRLRFSTLLYTVGNGQKKRSRKSTNRGDLLDKKMLKLNERSIEMPFSSDEEDTCIERPYTEPNGVIFRRVWRLARAEDLCGVASALLALKGELQEVEGTHTICVGVKKKTI